MPLQMAPIPLSKPEEIEQDLSQIYRSFGKLQRRITRALPVAERIARADQAQGEQSAGEERIRLDELLENVNHQREYIQTIRSSYKKGRISAAELDQAARRASSAHDMAVDTFDDIL